MALQTIAAESCTRKLAQPSRLEADETASTWIEFIMQKRRLQSATSSALLVAFWARADRLLRPRAETSDESENEAPSGAWLGDFALIHRR